MRFVENPFRESGPFPAPPSRRARFSPHPPRLCADASGRLPAARRFSRLPIASREGRIASLRIEFLQSAGRVLRDERIAQPARSSAQPPPAIMAAPWRGPREGWVARRKFSFPPSPFPRASRRFARKAPRCTSSTAPMKTRSVCAIAKAASTDGKSSPMSVTKATWRFPSGWWKAMRRCFSNSKTSVVSRPTSCSFRLASADCSAPRLTIFALKKPGPNRLGRTRFRRRSAGIHFVAGWRALRFERRAKLDHGGSQLQRGFPYRVAVHSPQRRYVRCDRGSADDRSDEAPRPSWHRFR